MQKRAKWARAALASGCAAHLLAVLFAGPDSSGHGEAHCHATMKIGVEWIGQRTSAEG
jgi:hypothetical protein